MMKATAGAALTKNRRDRTQMVFSANGGAPLQPDGFAERLRVDVKDETALEVSAARTETPGQTRIEEQAGC